MCELALELGIPVGELGQRMSAHELTVVWPAFFQYRNREAQRRADEQERKTLARRRLVR